jgi:tetratricopeptide (TPR) repeat protein
MHGADELAADALSCYADLVENLGEPDRAVALCEEALARYRRAGNERDTAFAYSVLGVVARKRGEFGPAMAFYEASMSAQRRRHSAIGIALAMIGFGEVAADVGDTAEAAAYFRASLRLHAEHRSFVGIGYCLLGLGKLADEGGRIADAIRLFAAAEGLWEKAGLTLQQEYRAAQERCVARARRELGEEAFAAAWAAAWLAPLEQVIAETFDGAGRVTLAPPSGAPAAMGAMPVSLSKRERDVLA